MYICVNYKIDIFLFTKICAMSFYATVINLMGYF